MEDVGKVVALFGTQAAVLVKTGEKCKGCKICTFSPKEKEVRILAENTAGAAVGDTVVVRAEKPLQFKASFFCYLMPLIFALAFMGIGAIVGEIYMMLFFFGGLFLGYLALLYLEKIFSRKREYAPAIREILKKAADEKAEENADESFAGGNAAEENRGSAAAGGAPDGGEKADSFPATNAGNAPGGKESGSAAAGEKAACGAPVCESLKKDKDDGAESKPKE